MTAAALHTCQKPRPQGRGALAVAGRAKLRAALTERAAPCGCDCDCCRCNPDPLTDLEAQRALRHVTNYAAVAYALGEVVLVGCRDCDGCGGWVPTFIEAAHR
ncbi:hypothetical protein JF732_14760 [Mycobacterium intracellulare]|uniref:Uncharacterized protein n=1 Tax=Mycobacterium intracellulare TaxID=1767 RepID=A0AAE4RG95_MYCIT|nr:hypothetical protein [Mycobacterium intracellulare]MCA2321561.1 hypothetical protein [Mycobacterium intracellulare]MCA2341807.1 hypothetical protein [Mycobacterium intracellulare]MDV6977906.1 hypothetical protein [Mycobacterium intracellulare]MDV6983320.1 hypothetical protein [Mycobacterium intracellulare]MDV7014342.1 hypothetical protein [Mycobacterium intracellulare]